MQNKDEPVKLDGTFNWLLFAARAHATCFTVGTRHTFGPEALGWNSIGAMVLILLYGAFTNSGEMFAFFALWLIAQIIQRGRTTVAISMGMQLHSHYPGHPWVGYLFPVVKSYRSAILVEASIVFICGFLLCSVSGPLGMFTMAGAGSMLMVYFIGRQAITETARRMRDAEIETRMQVDVYQGKYTDY